MAQFDVHRNPGAHRAAIPYVVIVQSRRFDKANRRVVIPLVRTSEHPDADPTINPTFEIGRTHVILQPLLIGSIDRHRLGKRVGTLAPHGDRVIAALDLLISRAWG